jgi:hypothetical protein
MRCGDLGEKGRALPRGEGSVGRGRERCSASHLLAKGRRRRGQVAARTAAAIVVADASEGGQDDNLVVGRVEGVVVDEALGRRVPVLAGVDGRRVALVVLGDDLGDDGDLKRC